jgi:malic enzyme
MRETVVIVVTGAAPGFLRPDLVWRRQTLLALSSFSPELEEAARAAEARYVADDQRLTTALVFPGIIRGALDAFSTRITDAMKIAAAVAIMRHCRGTDLLPSVLDPALHLHVAHAVQDCATREQTEPERVKGP